MDLGLLIPRVLPGLTMVVHGTQELFGWFARPGLEGTTGKYFATLGFSSGRRHALMAGLAEASGGLLRAFGLFTLFGAMAVISVMVVAVSKVHIKKGFFTQNGGYEHVLIVGAAALTLVFMGPDSISFDALSGHFMRGAFWGRLSLSSASLVD